MTRDTTMALMTQAKKPFLWICIVVAAFCVVLWQQNSSGIYRFAVNGGYQVLGHLNATAHNALSAYSLDKSPCQEEAACRIQELRERIRNVCLTDKKVKKVVQMQNFAAILNHKHKLLYFSIPKVGCSFWKRIFKVLNAKTNNTNMFDIPNYKAHTGPGLLKAQSRAEVKKYLPTYTSFLFVRDPFSRLFSGYIDKIFVPNPIAVKHGHALFLRYRSINGSGKQCEVNIPFKDFALYIADTLLSNKMSDQHFSAMWRQLNPCDINLTYVAKMESFMDDTNYILSSAGVSLHDVSGTKDDDFEEMHEKGYMEDIINRTYMYIRIHKPCISHRMVLQRLWTTFHIRGYLLKSIKMPDFKNPANVKLKEFVDATWRAYDQAPNSKEQRSQQRIEAMMEAYSTVPRPILKKLALAFDMDCRVFDYNCDVDELFPVRNNIKPFYFRM